MKIFFIVHLYSQKNKYALVAKFVKPLVHQSMLMLQDVVNGAQAGRFKSRGTAVTKAFLNENAYLSPRISHLKASKSKRPTLHIQGPLVEQCFSDDKASALYKYVNNYY